MFLHWNFRTDLFVLDNERASLFVRYGQNAIFICSLLWSTSPLSLRRETSSQSMARQDCVWPGSPPFKTASGQVIQPSSPTLQRWPRKIRSELQLAKHTVLNNHLRNLLRVIVVLRKCFTSNRGGKEQLHHWLALDHHKSFIRQTEVPC